MATGGGDVRSRGPARSTGIHDALNLCTSTTSDAIPDINGPRMRFLEDVQATIDDGQKPRTVLLYGLVGSGKTSILNTIYQSLTGKPYPLIEAGQGNIQSHTLNVKWYPRCNIESSDFRNLDPNVKQALESILKYMPNIIDCSGRQDSSGPQLEEILELLLEARIPPETRLDLLESSPSPPGSLSRRFQTSDPSWKVTDVVVVHGCTETAIPDLMLNVLHTIKKKAVGTYSKYSLRTYLLVTKHDYVREISNKLGCTDQKQRHLIDNTQFQQVLSDLANHKALAFGGRIKDYSQPWINVCDRVEHDQPLVSQYVFRFLKQMMIPIRQPMRAPNTVHTRNWLRQHKLNILALLLLIVAILGTVWFARHNDVWRLFSFSKVGDEENK